MTPISDFGYASSLPPSASNAMCWNVSALRMASLGFTPDNALLRQDLRHLLAGTGRATAAVPAGHAEEINSACGYWRIEFVFPAVNRGIGGVEPQIGIDETGI